MREPRQVDLLHHLLEAALDFTHQVGNGALENNLAARHRTRAQFVLEANDAVGVAAAVLQPAGKCEQREPLGAIGRALRARQQQRNVGIGMRAEPFVAIKPPLAVLASRDGFSQLSTFTAPMMALP